MNNRMNYNLFSSRSPLKDSKNTEEDPTIDYNRKMFKETSIHWSEVIGDIGGEEKTVQP